MLFALFLYLSLYTWNLRTGKLDSLASHTGLEFVGLILRPGEWVVEKTTTTWEKYIHLVEVHEENERLIGRIQELTIQLARAREAEAETARLRRLVGYDPPLNWDMLGARVIAHRVGPNALLESMLVDKGYSSGELENAPAVTPNGVVGRVLRKGPLTSNVLLLTDPNSRVAVRGRTNRTAGVLMGQGPDKPLKVEYVPLNAPLDEGELLVTSGLARIFPRGLPAAEIVSIERSDISLFQTVTARPLVDLRNIEDVLLLRRPAADEKKIGAAGQGQTAVAAQ